MALHSWRDNRYFSSSLLSGCQFLQLTFRQKQTTTSIAKPGETEEKVVEEPVKQEETTGIIPTGEGVKIVQAAQQEVDKSEEQKARDEAISKIGEKVQEARDAGTLIGTSDEGKKKEKKKKKHQFEQVQLEGGRRKQSKKRRRRKGKRKTKKRR